MKEFTLNDYQFDNYLDKTNEIYSFKRLSSVAIRDVCSVKHRQDKVGSVLTEAS